LPLRNRCVVSGSTPETALTFYSLKQQTTMNKLISKIETLQAIEKRTAMQSVYLANAEYKIESKTMSKVYRAVSESPYAAEILDGSPMPEFRLFCEAMKPNESRLYSVYQGFLTLKKFRKVSKVEKTAKKAARQNKATAKK